uniref:non-specific serine/threonine protein kinase n=1 Tax=Lactuca sativa TaxID=4236 RepID=A0A9R1VKR6_LACSA|nr:hypothetical protein LSAT_V11C500257770 [Lactuca sativa]
MKKNKERIIDTDDVVGEKFKLGRKIGKGAFCEVYAGVILESGEEVAIKLFNAVGIPSLKWFGVERGHNIMVIDLLGPNLQELLHRCGGKFSLKTVLMLADQLIEAVEFMHDKGVVHRDIKTENLLMGVGSNVCQVYLTDFGLANVVLDPETDEHIEYSLPWQGLSAGSNEEEINGDVMRKKFAIKPEELCESCPPEFAVWITSCQCTHFEDMLYYTSIKARCRRLFKSKASSWEHQLKIHE